MAEPSGGIIVRVDLSRIRANCADIARQTGVALLAVVKADAYGLGAARIARAIADIASGFCVFALEEAVAGKLKQTGRPTLVIGPPKSMNFEDYWDHNARPAVTTEEQATALRRARPAVSIDTGMQRFACPIDQAALVIAAGECREAFTHATRAEQALQMKRAFGDRGMSLHAAGSSLLHEPRAWLDAVRPGLAMYRDAVRMSSPLIEVHDTCGPAGYTGFTAARHGVILGGYSDGVRAGPCVVNGQRRRILEVGMQTSYVEIAAGDRVGDEVVLLGDNLSPTDVAKAWGCSPHEVLVRLASAGRKVYAG